jgi:hypothetical protein
MGELHIIVQVDLEGIKIVYGCEIDLDKALNGFSGDIDAYVEVVGRDIVASTLGAEHTAEGIGECKVVLQHMVGLCEEQGVEQEQEGKTAALHNRVYVAVLPELDARRYGVRINPC